MENNNLLNLIRDYESVSPFGAANLVKIILENNLNINDNNKLIIINDIKYGEKLPTYNCFIDIDIFDIKCYKSVFKLNVFLHDYYNKEQIIIDVIGSTKSSSYFKINKSLEIYKNK